MEPQQPGAADERTDPPQQARPPVLPRVLRVLAVVARGLGRWALRLLLPLAGAAALLHAFPYRATVQGVPFSVEGNLFARPGLSADTTLGSWEFPDLTGVPVGVTITPRDVDLLELTRAAGEDRAGFVARLQADFAEQLPRIAAWLVAEVVLGVLLGLLVAAAVHMSLRYLRGRPRRSHELRRLAVQLGGALGVVVLVAGYGVLTYNPNWVQQSRLTGTLAAAQLFPDQLAQYYEGRNKAFDVLGSVLGIQAELQDQIESDQAPETALRIMFISDMHLAATYPLVLAYARSYDVSLIVNTGDESLFGTGVELTPGYLDSVRAVAAQTPMLWIAGNHDSPDVEQTMRSIPGVTVLGSKTRTADGYAVRGGVVDAFGLTIAGIADPRVYGGPGAYGSDDPAVTEPLEREAVAEALAGVLGDDEEDGAATASAAPDGEGAEPFFDIVATHEPVQAEEVRELLPDQVRQTVSGHVHRQNEPGEIQEDTVIDLVEGSTGAGGLNDIVRGDERPPIEFSIESVAPDCQFTRVVRFSIDSSSADGATQAFGDDVTTSTVYFTPQEIDDGRTCSREIGVGAERPL
ncbi:metallophosphoesterase family protein [Geodermatophilus sp. SYSU D00815]